ncbi:MAG: hypothetical protein MN733_37860, partial [Nitrososphaera sp.]|nr:hypothetical protein [Nitrososphaera sp.]
RKRMPHLSSRVNLKLGNAQGNHILTGGYYNTLGFGLNPSADRSHAPPWRAALGRFWGSSLLSSNWDTMAAPKSERPLQDSIQTPMKD